MFLTFVISVLRIFFLINLLSWKATVFPVVMDGCESWTVKKAACWTIDAFEVWWWRRLLRVPWTARRSNQSILTEISPGCYGPKNRIWLRDWINWLTDYQCDMEELVFKILNSCVGNKMVICNCPIYEIEKAPCLLKVCYSFEARKSVQPSIRYQDTTQKKAL